MTINIDTLYSPRTFSPGARDAAMGASPNRGYLSTSNTIPQQSRNEAAAFQAENRQLRRQLEEMKAMASHVPRLFSSKSGKNAVRAARAAKYSAVDLLNLQEANPRIGWGGTAIQRVYADASWLTLESQPVWLKRIIGHWLLRPRWMTNYARYVPTLRTPWGSSVKVMLFYFPVYYVRIIQKELYLPNLLSNYTIN